MELPRRPNPGHRGILYAGPGRRFRQVTRARSLRGPCHRHQSGDSSEIYSVDSGSGALEGA